MLHQQEDQGKEAPNLLFTWSELCSLRGLKELQVLVVLVVDVVVLVVVVVVVVVVVFLLMWCFYLHGLLMKMFAKRLLKNIEM